MKHSEMNRYLYACKTVLAGLFTTQIIATVQVYLSNKSLHRSMQLVQEAGYLPVPNEHVWVALQGFGAAFWGGLFFTLSIGAGLSVIGLICAWTWDRLFGRKKGALVIYLVLWLLGIGAVNGNGFNALATAYLGIIPLVVFLVALVVIPQGQQQGERFYRIAYLGVPVFLLLLFLPLAKKSIFIDIRDTVLLSNSIGRKINGFYYDYTLYAAQAIKSLEQKTIRTCTLSLAENESHRDAIANIFLSHDYLVIDGEEPVDLSVLEQDGKLLFKSRDQVVLSTTLREFAANPSLLLQQFSRETDRFGPLRLVSFAGMIAGAPLCLYIILHGVFYLVLAVFMVKGRAGLAALLLCCLAGLSMALPLYGMKTQHIDADNLKAALASEQWQERVAALRYIEKNRLLSDQMITEAEGKLASPQIAERYWFVRALGSSRIPAANKILLAALNDPNTNVVCMALYALGRQENRSAAGVIRRRLEKSDKWYEQWYGYRALRSLGWKQQP